MSFLINDQVPAREFANDNRSAKCSHTSSDGYHALQQSLHGILPALDVVELNDGAEAERAQIGQNVTEIEGGEAQIKDPHERAAERNVSGRPLIHGVNIHDGVVIFGTADLLLDFAGLLLVQIRMLVVHRYDIISNSCIILVIRVSHVLVLVLLHAFEVGLAFELGQLDDLRVVPALPLLLELLHLHQVQCDFLIQLVVLDPL